METSINLVVDKKTGKPVYETEYRVSNGLFKKLNKNRSLEKRIKPFNFFLTGFEHKDDVKPITPFSDNSQEAAYGKFVDYRTGDILEGLEYWKPLSKTLEKYLEHEESKLKGDIGKLERKHIIIDKVAYIGKESNNLEITGTLEGPEYTVYQDDAKLKERILGMTNKEAYLKKHTSEDYELMGTAKDIFTLNESVVSLDVIGTADGRNVTLPIVCNKTGGIGSYSSCSLSNASNITYLCHNLTQNLSECDLEELNHGYWDDITYWITPNPGTLNLTQKFNFTIVSSRNRLEYAYVTVDYKRPNINKNLFNKSAGTVKGDKISITTTLNMTGKIYGGVIFTTYFKKKCYRYELLSQYMYG